MPLTTVPIPLPPIRISCYNSSADMKSRPFPSFLRMFPFLLFLGFSGLLVFLTIHTDLPYMDNNPYGRPMYWFCLILSNILGGAKGSMAVPDWPPARASAANPPETLFPLDCPVMDPCPPFPFPAHCLPSLYLPFCPSDRP